MKRDRGSYDELKQDAAKKWVENQVGQSKRNSQVGDALKREWVCRTCGHRHVSGGVCPRCRSARILEWDGSGFAG